MRFEERVLCGLGRSRETGGELEILKVEVNVVIMFFELIFSYFFKFFCRVVIGYVCRE